MSIIGAENGLLAGLLTAGLATGFTHCAAMCGPFVLAQAGPIEHGAPRMTRLARAALLPYHAGRVVTYTLLGALAGTVSGLTAFFSPLHSVLSALALSFAALVFLTTALPSLAALFPVLARVRLPLPGRLFHRALSALSRPRGPGGRFGLGLLMGLMPCGLVVAALLAAAVLGSPLKAAGGMAVFATGTLPGLLAVAFGGQALSRFNPAALKFVQPAMLVASTVILLLAAGRITLL